jgi:putative sigma-54 modulation protein
MVNVTFRRIEPTDAIHDYAVEKIDKAGKYLYRDFSAEVILTTEKFWQVAEIRVSGEKQTVVGTARTEDMYSAIDGAMDKVTEQLRRRKDRFHVPTRSSHEIVGEETG